MHQGTGESSDLGGHYYDCRALHSLAASNPALPGPQSNLPYKKLAGAVRTYSLCSPFVSGRSSFLFMLQGPTQMLPPLRSRPVFPGGSRTNLQLSALWIWGLQVLRVRGRPSRKGSRVGQRRVAFCKQPGAKGRARSVRASAQGCSRSLSSLPPGPSQKSLSAFLLGGNRGSGTGK